MFFRWLVNLCVYLGSRHAHIRHAHAHEIERLRRGKKPGQLRKNVTTRIKRLEHDLRFDLGTDVPVDHELAVYARNNGVGVRLNYRTLVRGHWRNQPCGAGRLERRLLWIAPHVRGTNRDDSTFVGHTYHVDKP